METHLKSFNLYGIRLDENPPSLWSTLFLWTMLVLTTTHALLSLFMVVRDFQSLQLEQASAISYTIITGMLVAKVIILFWKRRQIRELMTNIQGYDKFAEDARSRGIKKNYARFIARLQKYYRNYVFFSIGGYITIYLIRLAITGNRSLFFEMWYGELSDISNLRNYIIVIVLQLSIIILGATYHPLIDSYLYSMILQPSIELEIVENILKNVLNDSNNIKRIMEKKLIKCVLHHKRIYR